MRQPVSTPDVRLMQYGIREIVDVIQKMKELAPETDFVFENIGDPIAKSWHVPQFLKELIQEETEREGDAVFGYSHSRGLPSTRKWVVEEAKKFSPSSTLDYEYVLFTSGLGAAISALYHMLPQKARIIQPSPSYPTHASMESFNAGAKPVSYQLDPSNHWQPDLEDLEQQLEANPDIVGILIINPNNPTGAVYSKETLEALVKLAEKYGLMLISDEVYFRMVYNGHHFEQLTEIAQGRVPLMVLRGISKDVPWPGGRCGWIEFHNTDLDEDYKAYAESVKKRVLMEVCSVSLPQFLVPRIYHHPQYQAWLKANNAELEKNGNYIADMLNKVDGLNAEPTNGAFYMMPLFEEGVLNTKQTLPITNDAIRAFIEKEVARPNMALDQRFTYYLLAATGICTVPASGFFSKHPGFRITTLERDDHKRQDTYTRLTEATRAYIASA